MPPEQAIYAENEADQFAKASRYFATTQASRTTNAQQLRLLAQQALDQAQHNQLAEHIIDDIQILTTAIEQFGLSLAHVHMRINASQLHNALLGHIDIETHIDDPARKMTYQRQLDRLLRDAKPAKTHFGSLITETMSAKILFMLMSHMKDAIDDEQPIRFLIAECESSITPLIALYFAKCFGIENHIDISPLLETERALNKAPSLIADLLGNKHYRNYLKKRGRLCIQTGYSDAGRHLGQIACALAIERTHAQTANIIQKSKLNDIPVLFFDTHGESCGRGAHPQSFSHRLHYLSSGYAQEKMKENHVKHLREISFQGGDGYAWFMHKKTAYATTTRICEYVCTQKNKKKNAHDPFYIRPDEATEITHIIKDFNRNLMHDNDYAKFLSLFGHKLTYASGSRPHQRQYEGGGNLKRRLVSHWRAIPHNAVLHQIGFLATVIGGVGKAVRQHGKALYVFYQKF